MQYRTDDLRIKEIKELVPPSHVLREFGLTEKAARTVVETRHQIHRILHGADDRLVVIAGPCSIHDVKAAKDYAGRLADARQKLGRDLLIVMRVYFEKPRTTVGWKGLINDPNLDGSFSSGEGTRRSRHTGAAHGRFQPWQQQQELAETGRRRPRRLTSGCRGRRSHIRDHGRKPSQARTAGSDSGKTAAVWHQYHRRLHRL